MTSTTSQVKPEEKVVGPATRERPRTRAYPRPIRLMLILVAATAVLSLLYAAQYYLGGPIRLPVAQPVHDLILPAGGTQLVAAVEDGTIRVWDISQPGWPMRTLPGHRGRVTAVAGLPDGSLVSTGLDGTLRLWAPDSAQPVATWQVQGAPPVDLSVSADGTVLATLAQDGRMQVWDVASGQVIQTIDPIGEPARAVALSPDGSLVAAGDGAAIQIWEATTGAQVRRLEGRWKNEEKQDTWLGHKKSVTTLAFSPDGALVASGGDDALVVTWNVETGEVESTSEGHWAGITDVVFSAEGDALLSASRDTKALSWRVPGGKLLTTYEGHLSAVNAVAFGPTIDTVLSGSDDGTVREWQTVNQSVTHIAWTRYGLLPVWGRTLAGWMLLSGVVGLAAFWGLRQYKMWSHLLALALFLLGAIIVLGLPLLEATSYPISWPLRLRVMAPLLGLAVWYIILLIVMTREQVTAPYQAPAGAALSEQLMASRRSSLARLGLYATAVWILVLVILYSVLRRFQLDVAFMGHWLSFIVAGAGTTVLVSAASIALAVLLALLGALGRLSKNPIAGGISSFYISLIRGTPLLVQIYIWYLGLPRLDIVLPAIPAGILALGVNYGAYMTETFRAGIQAIGKGQHEAAHALGMSAGQTFRRIVLPQAFRIVVPPIGNDFIAMMKDSSLVSIITVWELSYRAQKIGRQYFRGLETFLIAAAFYWILTVIFQFLQGKLETYLARSERK